MALTDNSFTGEEFTAAIAANPDLMPIIKGTLSANKFIIQDEAEHNTFLQNHESEVATKVTKTHAEKLEADVLKATGIAKKSPDEKYYDYFLRATGEKLSTVSAMQTELEALKTGVKPNEIDKARITELEKALADKTTEYSGKLTEKETEILNMKKGSKFDTALVSVRGKYKQGLPEDMVKISEGAIVKQLLSEATIQEDGTITFPKEDGTPELDAKTYKPVTIEQKLEEKLASLLDPAKIKIGTGSKDDVVIKKKEDGSVEFSGVPAGITTKLALSNYLYSIGITSDSEEYDKIMAEHGKDLKLK